MKVIQGSYYKGKILERESQQKRKMEAEKKSMKWQPGQVNDMK